MLKNLAGIKTKPVAVVSDGPVCPREIFYLWQMFGEISLGLAENGMAIPVVTWESLLAWSLLRGVSLERWESAALVRLGQIRKMVLSESTATKNPKGSD